MTVTRLFSLYAHSQYSLFLLQSSNFQREGKALYAKLVQAARDLEKGTGTPMAESLYAVESMLNNLLFHAFPCDEDGENFKWETLKG